MLLSMNSVATWVPMRWPESWSDAALLNLLDATPFNCLVLRASGPPPSAALVEEAHRRGLALVGLGAGAAQAPWDAVAREDAAGGGVPVIAWADKSKLAWNSAAAGFALAESVWPAIPSRDTAEGGPTGAPWVDSNGWSVQLARAFAGGRPIWVDAAPPAAARPHAGEYVLAVADAAAYGARWVVTLDDKLAAALAVRDARALETWRAIAGAARFFELHREWATLAPYANVAVVSDFAGPNEYVAQELLNLLPRRGVPYRVCDKARASEAPLDGLAGIIYPDQDAPAPALASKFLGFVRAGGVLLAHARWPVPEGIHPTPDTFGRWNVYALDKGRLAISIEEGLDPYQVAADAQLLIGHRWDLVRYFNFSALNGYYTASDGRAVLHVLNYAVRPWVHPVSIVFARSYRTARLWRPGTGDPTPLALEQAPHGVELHLPPLGAYAAIELEL
jgi:hypothetical protein